MATLERARPHTSLTRRRSRVGPYVAAAGCLLLIVMSRLPGEIGVRGTAVAVAFVSLVIQSLPFLLAGVLVVGLLRGRAGERLLSAASRRPRIAAALAPFSGVALPLCDCGLVPLARELNARGSRWAVAGFVAGAPLTNPIVIVSTLVAFPGSPGIVVGRVAVGVAVAMIVGALAPPPAEIPATSEHHESPGLAHALGEELARTGPVLVLGALAAGLVKGLVPASALASITEQPLIGAAAMMLLAFLISLCAQADAFVAASLPVGTLPRLAFLVLGPMLDLRLGLLYRKEFGGRWVATYAAIVVPTVLVLCTVWVTWGLR